MAINFPNNPNPNDTWSEVGKTWLWDGTSWKLNSTTASGIALTDLSVTKPNPTANGSGDLTYNNSTGAFTYTPPVVGSTSFIGLSDTPGSLTAGKWLKVNTGGTALEYVDNTFINLTDTPSSLNAGKWLKVNAGGTALEWANEPSGGGGGSSTFTGLTDTPGTFTAQKFLKVNALGNALEWTDVEKIKVLDESSDTECYPLFTTEATGDLEPKTGTNIKFNALSGQLEAGSFKKTSGTSSEFLKADGSVDTNTYSQSNHTHSYALGDLSNVDATTNLANGKILKYDLASTSWVVADDNASGGGSGNFTGLSDTPGSLTADKWLKVNSGGTALEWTNAPSSATINNNADNRIITGTATANTLNAESSLTYDGTKLNLGDDKKITFGNNLRMEVYTDGSANYIKSATDGSGAFPLSFYSGSTEAIKIDSSGNTIIGGNLTVSGTQTIVNSNTVNIGDNILVLNSDETGTPSQNGGIEIERGTSTNVSLRWNETTDKWQYTNDGSNFSDIGSGGPTYDMKTASVTGGGIIRLENEITNTTDDVQILGGTNITVERSADHKLTIKNDITNLNSLSDVTISGSIPNGYYLKYDTNDSQWKPDDPSNIGGTNNYASSLSWNTSNGVLTVNRSGLSAITVDLDGRYATGTIPTNNNQLTNGAGYLTSSGTITNAEKVRIRTDTGNTMHNLVFVDSYSDNQFQVLKVDNATNSLCYNPNSNRLIGQDFQSYRMTSWTGDYGDYGQFLMSNGSTDWEWSQYVEQKSNGELLLKATGGNEGGHLQFEDMNGNTSYAIDVYRNSSSGDKVLRFIDQSQSLERFSVGPQGQWGIGHVGARDYGSLGQVMISRGGSLSPQWGNASGIAAIAEIAATADTASSNINNIYAQLAAIGADDTITTVAELKNALLELLRS